uniref:Peptidoglycan binding-like domain-containing protein n=1 Tax=Chenopodium quinoa TaxID=63459 RepID=A0A803LPC0_CHEQI
LRASSNPSDYEAEEQRWLREEHRWLREEQRWLREEARWNSERQSLLRQISELSLQIQHLQSELDDFRSNRSNSADFEVTTPTKMAALLEAKNSNQILDFSGSEEVRAMQDALMKLGFYSGEEDMEFSYFSTDTERAVKTWQASIGIREDGIMTIELLDQLYAPQQISSPKTQVKADIPKVSAMDETGMDKANGAPIKVKEVQQTVAKKVPTDVGIPEHRVFLLGENRWEEPSRLNKGNDKLGGGKSSAPKCLSCRGEGRLLCMECDGTGDSQVEEQGKVLPSCSMEYLDPSQFCPTRYRSLATGDV